ncbi:MAG: hypothetical protein ACKO2Q_12945 [Actinomycetota bacterium]|jgi:hypothetical protein
MNVNDRFQQVIRVTDALVGPHIPNDLRGDWPDAQAAGVTFDNTAEWQWESHDIFARRFDEQDDVELLIVITSVSPFDGYSELVDALNAVVPDTIEIDITDDAPGAPVMAAMRFDIYDELTDADLSAEVASLLDVTRRIAATVCA